jgi:hypothetical protein
VGVVSRGVLGGMEGWSWVALDRLGDEVVVGDEVSRDNDEMTRGDAR